MIAESLKERILILDGAMGTAIQALNLSEADFRGSEFENWRTPLKGDNDILNLTAPHHIEQIHRSYIEAGADIISTNTFNSNAISQSDYGCEDYVERICMEGAKIARRAADGYGAKEGGRRIWVAGSMGPTSKTLSLSPDINHPEERSVDFDTMAAAYATQARGLIKGGVDLLLVETCFDALNTKAALYAIDEVEREMGRDIPVMVSATINDKSGRTLTGQSLEAFYTSISHFPILSFGLNCSFGVTELKPFIERLARSLPCYISIHPNAGLPNEMGEYDEEPCLTAKYLRDMAEEGLINIAGGCCGTTAAHIRAIAEALRGLSPHIPNERDRRLIVSGLDNVIVDKEERNFTNIGERTNVAGSRKFARLISEKKYEEAAEIARRQIEDGADIIDINMDDAMLDGAEEMKNFVRYISNDPAIAKAAFMIDSSSLETILEGLKNSQGRCIVNSISLKEGEVNFLRSAREIAKFGAAVVVMAFDEEGQATNFERKIAICERAYKLLTEKASYRAEDIIFDVNVLSVGTGIETHDAYAIDFIRAVEWIKKNLPGVKTSGGISNLSFAFRGNNSVREALHSVFLYHAIGAGLDMGIVNPSMLQIYDEIEPHLLKCAEDLILNRTPNATEALTLLASEIKERESGEAESGGGVARDERWRMESVDERLTHALSKGRTDFLEVDIREALAECGGDPVKVIEGPLMRAMERIGTLFGEGKMFLPQVVKSAKVMKEAVEILQPEIERRNAVANGAGNAGGASQSGTGATVAKPKVVIATVKGDVHDIGKNIVSIVLACNNFEVIDLGVMVESSKIIECALAEKADIIAVSGLITPSLKEMELLCDILERENIRIPLIVGGATTSEVHTAVKLAPRYSYCVVHGGDASQTSVLAKRLTIEREKSIAEIKERQEEIRTLYYDKRPDIIPYEEANAAAPHFAFNDTPLDIEELRKRATKMPTLEEVAPYIDWLQLLLFWNFRGASVEIIRQNPEAEKTLTDARATLEEVLHDGTIELKSLVKFVGAHREGNDILFESGERMAMLRSQTRSNNCLSLVDFLPSEGSVPVGLFCVTTRDKKHDHCDCKTYPALMRQAICARLAEAAAVWIEEHIYGKRHVIRPAFGYPACPDHSLKRELFEMTSAEKLLGVTLTENYAIKPSTTICGLFIAHPEARYFSIGRIDEEQLADYARRRGMSIEEVRSILAIK